MAIKKEFRKTTFEEQCNDFALWQTQPYEIRLATVEQIRREYHFWKYGAEPGFQRVLKIIKR